MSRPRARLASVVFVLLAAGCTVESDPVPTAVVVPTTPADGTLLVDWTISGVADPAQCRQALAEVISITVYFDVGQVAGTFEQRCDVFATSIPLQAGTYSGSAVLLDINRQPRTTVAVIDPFTIFGNDQLSIPLDFPADSFL